jgi:hypothetical protein
MKNYSNKAICHHYILHMLHCLGQGESAGTLVLTVETQLLEIVYFWKFDTKFD